MFASRHPPVPQIFYKFSGIFGAEVDFFEIPVIYLHINKF